ncbi:MAG: hypothetical protein KJZ75_08120 [Hyphomonadaceae bacterium]|nr:hypothetical protein [Hyphomonadaceae bacterium]MCL4714860.1 hypothetical protein [Hyphomonadaceae bacterium]
MTFTRPHTPKDDLQALYACAVLWLCRLAAAIARLGAPRRSRTLKRIVRRRERLAEFYIFLLALNRVRPRPRRTRVRAGPGFRRVEADMRLMVKGARIRLRNASLRARVLRLIDVLMNPEPYIARFAARLRRGLTRFRLIAAAPAAVALVSAPALAPAAADSS